MTEMTEQPDDMADTKGIAVMPKTPARNAAESILRDSLARLDPEALSRIEAGENATSDVWDVLQRVSFDNARPGKRDEARNAIDNALAAGYEPPRTIVAKPCKGCGTVFLLAHNAEFCSSECYEIGTVDFVLRALQHRKPEIVAFLFPDSGVDYRNEWLARDAFGFWAHLDSANQRRVVTYVRDAKRIENPETKVAR